MADAVAIIFCICTVDVGTQAVLTWVFVVHLSPSGRVCSNTPQLSAFRSLHINLPPCYGALHELCHYSISLKT